MSAGTIAVGNALYNLWPFLKAAALSDRWGIGGGSSKGCSQTRPILNCFGGQVPVLGRRAGRGRERQLFLLQSSEKGSSLTRNSTGRNDLQFDSAFGFLQYHSRVLGKKPRAPKPNPFFPARTGICWSNSAPHPKLTIFKRALSARAVQHLD